MNLLTTNRLKSIKDSIHITLLLFLLVFTVDKIVLKAAGIVLIYLLHPDFRFKQKIRNIPTFYLLIVAFELLKFVFFNTDFSKAHIASFTIGCAFWICSFLCLYQLRSITDTIDKEKTARTLTVFFLINAGISLLNLLLTMYQSGSINPYTVTDERFNASTGDFIKGLFMAPCYINMMVNAFFIFFFLYREKIIYALLAAAIAIITTSNFANIILIPVLVACFIFSGKRKIRFSIIACFLMLGLFYVFVSPSNLRYLKDSIDTTPSQTHELIEYEKAILSQNAAHFHDEVRYGDSTELITLSDRYGKVLSLRETGAYLLSGPGPFLLGAGVGSYSSFLALRTSGLGNTEGSRLFRYVPEYRSPAFEKDHYQIFKMIYLLPKAFHSIKHFPNSFANQLFGEYGIIGFLLFIFTYVWFFFKRFKQLTYGKYLLFLLGGFLLFDYLFEYLSVVVLFELLMLTDMKKGTATNETQPANAQ